jgi:hypothetical protein
LAWCAAPAGPPARLGNASLGPRAAPLPPPAPFLYPPPPLQPHPTPTPTPPQPPPQVALALIIKRYSLPPSKAAALPRARRILRNALIAGLVGSAAGLGIAYNLDRRFWVYLIVIAIHAAITAALHVFIPQAPRPAYTSPGFPYVPSASLLVNSWLCSTLPGSAWLQYLGFLAVVGVVYFGYSVAGSLALQEHSGLRPEPSLTGLPRPPCAVRVLSLTEDGRGLRSVAPPEGGRGKDGGDGGDGEDGGKAGGDATSTAGGGATLAGVKAVELV